MGVGVESVLVSWIGQHDLNAISEEAKEKGVFGPIFSALNERNYSHAYFLYNYDKKNVLPYLNWLKAHTKTQFHASFVALKSPIDFRDIHLVSDAQLKEVIEKHADKNIELFITPGTPAMLAVWVILGKARYDRYNIRFIQSSLQHGVQVADIPFDIAADFLPATKSRLSNFASRNDVVDTAFEVILTEDSQMNELKIKATILAKNDLPVLILGETGTGKELFAENIHKASSRNEKPYVVVNCGAIQKELMRSELFGHKKGSFTGALKDKKGLFEAADGGTLFLDEFGDLPADAQVGLLRALQSHEILPVGGNDPITVDVRIIAATNKDLLKEINNGDFREDLFFRVAVGVLEIPPLRERSTGDLAYLSERILEEINLELKFEKPKSLSASAKRILHRHDWKGNFRELQSTLLRACLWSVSDKINEADIDVALIKNPHRKSDVLGRDISQGIDIEKIIGEVAEHYIIRAWDEANGKKSRAAELLGFANYQRLDTWMKKYGIEK